MARLLAAALALSACLAAGYVLDIVREPMPAPPITAFGREPGALMQETFAFWRRDYYAPVAPEWLEFSGGPRWLKSVNSERSTLEYKVGEIVVEPNVFLP